MKYFRFTLTLMVIFTTCFVVADELQPVNIAQTTATVLSAPLVFEKNIGQFDAEVQFLSRSTSGTTYYFTERGVTILLSKTTNQESVPGEEFSVSEKAITNSHSLKISFVGANVHPSITPEEQTVSKVNYFKGKDPAKWKTGVSNYQRIRYHNIYNGIDLVYYGNGKQLEYDFVVHPGADPNVIRVHYEGSEEALALLENGSVAIRTSLGLMHEKKPYVYQMKEKKSEVVASWKQINETDLQFSLGEYDKTQTLYIDPVIFSTFIGGNDFDVAGVARFDSSGNMYFAGSTHSGNFPATPGVIDETYGGGGGDWFLLKLSADGSTALFCTFIGGSGYDYGYDVQVDKNGDLYVTGLTQSSEFPTSSGAYDETYNGSDDVAVIKLSPDGEAILYSTFIGGSGSDKAFRLAIDELGSAYVTGYAQTGFPITPGVVQSTNNGGYDAFVAKLSPSGSQLEFSTYLGGSGDMDTGNRVLLDSDHNIYIGGYLNSPDFPTTSGAYQQSYQGGTFDAFVTKLNPTATEYIFSTYLGGNNEEYLYDITFDANRNVYITGSTKSSNFPTTPGCYDTTHNGTGTEDGFITKLNPSASNVIFSTFVGGSNNDEAIISVLDSNGDIVFSGVSTSIDFPTTDGAYDRTHNGNWDIVMGKLSADGSSLLYGTFIGGWSTDYGWWMNKDQKGDFIISGRTSSSNFPTTIGAFDQTYNGGADILVLKFRFGTSLLKGKVFNDQNANGVFDAQEYTLANFPVELQPGSVFTTTTNDGEYSFSVTPGSYQISQISDTNWSQTSPLNPSTYSLNPLGGDSILNLDFGNKVTRLKIDLAVDMVPIFPLPLTTPCCGQPMWYMIRYRNLGTVAPRGTKLHLHLISPQLVFQPPATTIPQLPPPVSRGRTLEFSLPSPLLPGKSGTIYVKAYVNCLPTETPSLRASAIIPMWDNNNSNNKVLLDNKATCSHDPNDKQVTPIGCGPTGLINRNDTLTYTIRFQNNGTGPARRVILRDTLDADLDLSTVKPLLASHAYVFEAIGNELVWTFYPIDLPDSASDELGSQGYVKFQVRPREDALNGTTIHNNAGIYFDLNEPVITNSTFNTITDDPLPRGNFRIVNEMIYIGDAVNFEYTGGTTDAQFLWNFGEGAIPETSYAPNPTGVIFSSVGPSVISLDVITENCVAPVSFQVIDVLDTTLQVKSFVVNERWNLVSLPLIPSNAHVDSVFPGRISAAISFEQVAGYQSDTLLRNGKGYWVKFTYPATFPVSGTEIHFDSVEISEGWNMIGSITDSVPFASLQTSPENILSSFLYGYERNYRSADILIPGKGYWIKANDSGKIYFSRMISSYRKNDILDAKNLLHSLNELVIRDADENEQHLYFGKSHDGLTKYFVLPPMPPSEEFDVRFTNGLSVAILADETENIFPIRLSGVAYPLKISWNIQQVSVRALIHSSEKSISLEGKSTMTIQESSNKLRLELQNKTANVVPDEFSLHQAFPNPFNPTTKIMFDVPYDASITLKVFDVLGREVAILTENQHYDAGIHEAIFDASNLASGLYLYRITAHGNNAVSFSDFKKMLLIR